MQTADGKIYLLKTSEVNTLLSNKSVEIIKNLKSEDSRKYLWFRTEQTVAYPIITEVTDKDPNHNGGRTWVQNQTFLVNIHAFLSYTQNGGNPFQVFESYVVPEFQKFPLSLEPLIV